MATSTKGKQIAFIEGYEMREAKLNAVGTIQFWRCNDNRSCNAWGRSPTGTKDVVMTKQHNHLANPAKHYVSEDYFIIKIV